ncbi:hypothetical protein CRG98_005473 [Punica granatum]|uniref:Uncharacterized protein n=1 Tax=Punica granatum TaxID=22663 RepID=A0A2I0L084_PUNGR|nr:hypothetical protein CRG98_005473 [Punica granatum]
MLGRGPKAVNAGPRPDAGPKPNAVNAGPELDAGPEPDARPKPNVVNAGPKPDAINAGPKPNAGPELDVGPKPNAVNAGPEPDAGPELDAGPKPNAVNACSIRKCEDRGWSTREGRHNSPVVRGGWLGWTASGHSTSRHGEVKIAGGLPAKVGTAQLACLAGWMAGMDGLWSQHVSPWRGEDRRWSSREGRHNSPVVRDMVFAVQTLDVDNV